MKIYTKTGDKGQTSLASGQRVFKNDLRLQAYGTVDELNSLLGIIINKHFEPKVVKLLQKIQNDLFTVGADLATPLDFEKFKIDRIGEDFVAFLESAIDYYNAKNQPLKNFILPGGNEVASFLHLSRTVCRRAERELVTLSENVEINGLTLKYLNRLSDLLFVLARYSNSIDGDYEIKWNKENAFNFEDFK